MREYHFLRALSRDAEVDYLYFADPGSDALKLTFCRSVLSVPKPATYTFQKKLAGLAGRWPLPILNYTCPLMMRTVRKAIARNNYTLIHLDSIHMFRYADQVSAPVVYNWHNIESEVLHRYARTARKALRSAYARITASKMERLEREILATRFGHIVCSERERALLSSIEQRARLAVIENGVDTEFFDASWTSTPGAVKSLVFVGAMDFHANIDAVLSFATTIWPLVHDRQPDLQFVVVGANPPREIQNLARIPGIDVTGTVADVRPYYQTALAAIVPVRVGGGTRLKILEAMAAGVPVISTPLGAEGLEVKPDIHILFAESGNADSWFGQISRLTDMPELRRSLSANAQALVRARYDWEILGRKLTHTYRQWLSEPSRG